MLLNNLSALSVDLGHVGILQNLLDLVRDVLELILHVLRTSNVNFGLLRLSLPLLICGVLTHLRLDLS